MNRINEQLLDERLAALEAARPWSPRVISKLEGHIRSADDVALFRINPLRFGVERNIADSESIDLFLHAAAVGLFDMNWLVLCPLCASVAESFRALRNVNSHFHCTLCRADYIAELDDYIAITFTVSPSVREIPFHHPDQLSVGDYCYRYKVSSDGHLSDGTPFAASKEASTKALQFLPRADTTRLEISVSDGLVFGWSADSDANFLFSVDPARAPTPQTVRVRYSEDVCEPKGGSLAPGPLTFEIENATLRRAAFGLMSLPADFAPPKVQFTPFLSGKQVLTNQTFRDLFRSEVIRANEGIGVKDIALLFTDLKGSTALYDRIGDLNAFALVQQHFDRLQSVTVRHNGAIIKTIGDAVMAAFLDPADAVRAAFDMRDEIASFNRGQPDKELILKIGIHKGAAIAVTQNERLDYFGQTVNIAARVQNLADADEIYVTKDVYDAPGVGERLSRLRVEPQSAQLRGVQQEFQVFRVVPSMSAEARVA